MKRFLVKIISKATEINPNFAGTEFISSYYGKNRKLLGHIGHIGSYAEASHTAMDLRECLIKEYGYTRECDAKRSWWYKNPETSKNWTSTCEVVEFDIDCVC